jgi:hypothetical protein
MSDTGLSLDTNTFMRTFGSDLWHMLHSFLFDIDQYKLLVLCRLANAHTKQIPLNHTRLFFRVIVPVGNYRSCRCGPPLNTWVYKQLEFKLNCTPRKSYVDLSVYNFPCRSLLVRLSLQMCVQKLTVIAPRGVACVNLDIRAHMTHSNLSIVRLLPGDSVQPMEWLSVTCQIDVPTLYIGWGDSDSDMDVNYDLTCDVIKTYDSYRDVVTSYHQNAVDECHHMFASTPGGDIDWDLESDHPVLVVVLPPPGGHTEICFEDVELNDLVMPKGSTEVRVGPIYGPWIECLPTAALVRHLPPTVCVIPTLRATGVITLAFAVEFLSIYGPEVTCPRHLARVQHQ